MKKKLMILLAILVVLMPYKILFQDYANTLICMAAALYTAFFIKEIRGNKIYAYSLCALTILAIVSLCFTNGLIESMEGITVYLCALIFYFIFSQYNEYRNCIIESFVYAVSAGTLFYIIIQGAIYKGGILKNRIDGNIGYANTYALMLLAALYLNEVREKKDLNDIIQILLSAGILFTGSRNTLFYLIIFYLVKIFIDLKNKRGAFSGFNFFISLVVYVVIEKMGFEIIIILPVILLALNLILDYIPMKVKSYAAVSLVGLAIPAVLLFNTTFTTRIKEMSFKSSELQQRFVYFKDALHHIIKYPLGSGINTFIYRQGSDQSALYDVRYIHNSILQVGYDIGIIGMVLFVFVAMFGMMKICKSKNENKIYYLCLYVTIYLHSLLDFDFAYAFTFVILVMIVAFSERREDIKKGKKEVQGLLDKIYIKPILLSSIVLIFTSYLALVGLVEKIGDIYLKNGAYSEARSLYSFNKSMTFGDYNAYLNIAETFNAEGKESGNIALIEKSIENIKIAEKINPQDPKILGNLAFSYELLGNDKETMNYYEKFIKVNKLYYDMYRNYYKYLDKRYSETNNEMYKDKMSNLEDTYENNIKQLTPQVKKYFGPMPQSIR